MFPRGGPPQGGWPVVAWAHGTVGVADICAPSVNRRSLRDRDYLNAYLAAGYAIVASDYQGLGTVGPHPYMTMRPVGYSVLDNVRAALKTYPQLANKVFLIGHSQGSQAAISAAVEALGYAPEVNVLGTVATGLAASIIEDHPAPTVAAVWPVQKEGNYIGSAVMMMQYAGTYPAIDPHFDYRPFMSPRTAPLFELTQTSCPFYMGNELAKYVNSHEIRIPEVFPRPLPTELRQRLEKHMYFSFEQARISQPVFTGSGLADTLAPVANHYNFISAMCYQGTTVDWHYYDGESHSSAVIRSQPDALAFMEKLLNGERVESNCGNLREPGPIQATKPGLPY
jgi:pimeloyl-ACP methyl ester carboxylesterase